MQFCSSSFQNYGYQLHLEKVSVPLQCLQTAKSLIVEDLMKLFCIIYWQNPQITAAVHYFQKQPPEVLCKKMCSLKVRKYLRKIPVLESVFNEVTKKETPTQKFSCEICEIFKSPYFEEHLPTTASIPSLQFSSSFILSSFLPTSEAAVHRSSTKQVYLKIVQISQENTCAGVSLIKLQT